MKLTSYLDWERAWQLSLVMCIRLLELFWMGYLKRLTFQPDMLQLDDFSSCFRSDHSTKSWLQLYLLQVNFSQMATAPQEMKVKTLEGEMLAVEVVPTNTVKELRAMLLESKHCEDPIERQLLRVEVLTAGLLIDDDQTVESAGLSCAESDVTVVYARREVEAATKESIHLWVSSSRPMLRKLPLQPFETAIKFWRWQSQSLWNPLGRTPLQVVGLWHVSLSLSHWQSSNHAPLYIACLWKASLYLNQ